jgi:hypothetical protein
METREGQNAHCHRMVAKVLSTFEPACGVAQPHSLDASCKPKGLHQRAQPCHSLPDKVDGRILQPALQILRRHPLKAQRPLTCLYSRIYTSASNHESKDPTVGPPESIPAYDIPLSRYHRVLHVSSQQRWSSIPIPMIKCHCTPANLRRVSQSHPFPQPHPSPLSGHQSPQFHTSDHHRISPA